MKPLKFIVATLLGTMMISAGFTSEELAQQNNCLTCHGLDAKIIGPGFNEIAAKYKDDASAKAMLVEKIKTGGVGNWGQIPMPPNPAVGDEDLSTLVDWILSL